jgi:hypothetical protein
MTSASFAPTPLAGRLSQGSCLLVSLRSETFAQTDVNLKSARPVYEPSARPALADGFGLSRYFRVRDVRAVQLRPSSPTQWRESPMPTVREQQTLAQER